MTDHTFEDRLNRFLVVAVLMVIVIVIIVVAATTAVVVASLRRERRWPLCAIRNRLRADLGIADA